MVSIKPDQAGIYFKIGLSSLILHQYEEAVQSLERSVKLDPKDADAHYALGAAYHYKGQRENALKEYEILKTLKPDLAAEFIRKM